MNQEYAPSQTEAPEESVSSDRIEISFPSNSEMVGAPGEVKIDLEKYFGKSPEEVIAGVRRCAFQQNSDFSFLGDYNGLVGFIAQLNIIILRNLSHIQENRFRTTLMMYTNGLIAGLTSLRTQSLTEEEARNLRSYVEETPFDNAHEELEKLFGNQVEERWLDVYEKIKKTDGEEAADVFLSTRYYKTDVDLETVVEEAIWGDYTITLTVDGQPVTLSIQARKQYDNSMRRSPDGIDGGPNPAVIETKGDILAETTHPLEKAMTGEGINAVAYGKGTAEYKLIVQHQLITAATENPEPLEIIVRAYREGSIGEEQRDALVRIWTEENIEAGTDCSSEVENALEKDPVYKHAAKRLAAPLDDGRTATDIERLSLRSSVAMIEERCVTYPASDWKNGLLRRGAVLFEHGETSDHTGIVLGVRSCSWGECMMDEAIRSDVEKKEGVTMETNVTVIETYHNSSTDGAHKESMFLLPNTGSINDRLCTLSDNGSPPVEVHSWDRWGLPLINKEDLEAGA